jgi:hypothetical protein
VYPPREDGGRWRAVSRPGKDLIDWYLNPGRRPVDDRWSRKHAVTQASLCKRLSWTPASEVNEFPACWNRICALPAPA